MELLKHLSAFVTTQGIKFKFSDKPISYQEVFSPKGLLPGIARRADQLCSLCLGYGIGVAFEDLQNAPLGIQVTFDEVTPDILRLLCIIDVISELVKNAPASDAVSLDELLYD